MPRFAMTGQRSSLKGSRCGIDTVISGNRISMLLAEKSGIALELQATVLGGEERVFNSRHTQR